MGVDKSFESVFNAYFHQKISFSEFLSLNVLDEISEIKIPNTKKTAYKCSNKLKLVHGFLNVFVFNKVEFKDDVVFSYRKKMNVVDALLPHANKRVIYKTDITSFFPSIDIETVRSALVKHCDKSFISNLFEYVDFIVELISVCGKLPIGFSTSPVISNFAFLDYDIKIFNFCKKNGLTYTRYADDILISGDGYLCKDDLSTELQSVLSTNGGHYKINHKKTKILTKGNTRVVFGVSILPDGRLTISRRLKNDIETKIHLFLSDKLAFTKYSGTSSIAAALVNISGVLNYVNAVDPDYLDKLRCKYGASIVGLLLKKVIENEYKY